MFEEERTKNAAWGGETAEQEKKLGGLLGMMAQGENIKPYYMVGQRGLNSSGGETLFSASPNISHHHFIKNDGAGNFGFSSIGEFIEPPALLVQYSPTSKYGERRYDADLLEMAHRHWQDMRDNVEMTAYNMGLQEDWMPAIHHDYHWLANNCQHFVSWLNKEYDRLFSERYK
ncbi:MAG: hypothetical protein ACI4P0_05410, partial [Mailhella sp.]